MTTQPFNYFTQNPAAAGDFTFGVGVVQGLKPGQTILEAAAPDGGVLGDFAGSQTRSGCMAAVLAWIEGGDFSFDALNAACFVINDMDESGDLSDDEQDAMNECMQGCADAFIALGGEPSNVAAFVDDEDDAAGATLGAFLSEKMSGTTMDDDEIIANYAVGGDLVLESMVRVVRGGKIALKRKRIGRPKKITALQKASLKKARMRAFSGAAKVHRAKSMKIRKQKGLS